MMRHVHVTHSLAALHWLTRIIHGGCPRPMRPSLHGYALRHVQILEGSII